MSRTKKGVTKTESEANIIAELRKRERDYRDFLSEYEEFLSIAKRIGNERCRPETEVQFGLAKIAYGYLRSTLDQMAEPCRYVRGALSTLRTNYPNIFNYINRGREK